MTTEDKAYFVLLYTAAGVAVVGFLAFVILVPWGSLFTALGIGVAVVGANIWAAVHLWRH